MLPRGAIIGRGQIDGKRLEGGFLKSRPDAIGARDLRTLFSGGVLTGLTDGQLLECFATKCGDTSEQAFAFLVERHGPLVLHACRAVLRDEHDARDAFQATFLILARRGRSLWVRDSVGPWLYSVARHTSLRARRNAHRRRVVERQVVCAARPPREPGDEGLASVIHEEIDRLPERYRIPVLLCDLEGRTYEEAARHVGCPVGTVKSRLARGRARLRASLTRRGVAPSAGAFVAVPAAWARDAVRAATSPIMSSAVSAAVCSLTSEALKSMLLIQLRAVSGVLAIGMITLSAFAVAAGLWSSPLDGSPLPSSQPKGVATPAGLFAPQAWRSEPYRPPDFAGFFPDDPDGATALAALWDEAKIEILYHAMDYRDDRHYDNATRRFAQGPCSIRVRLKTHALLRALVEFGMREDNPSILSNIVTAAALDGPAGRSEMLADRSWYRTMVAADPPAEVAADGPYAKPLENLYDFVGSTYPNFEMKGIDWTAVGRELLPRASSAKTEREFGLLVEELVARLEDSHAAVVPGTAQPPMPDLPRWDPGFACLIDDRSRPVVYYVDHGSPADRAGIAPGMAIVSVNGVKAIEAMDCWMRRQKTYVGYSSDRLLRADAAWGFVRQDKKGDRLALVLAQPDGASKSVEVAADLGVRYLPRLPVPRPGIVDAADVSWTKLDGPIGYIYVRRIRQGLERSLDTALRELGDIRGLILDARGNSGGGFDTATAFVNFDTAQAAAGGPVRPRYAGPIALLLDERTISAGEGWASWFVARRRARVFGSTSAGASSRKVTYDLTNGLYKVVVPVKAYTGSLDRPIERRGLEPDVKVRCTVSDLSHGKDTVVETAAEWLRKNSQ